MSEHKRYSVVDEVFQLRKENATLRADNERMREALTHIAEGGCENYVMGNAQWIARAALANEGKSDE